MVAEQQNELQNVAVGAVLDLKTSVFASLGSNEYHQLTLLIICKHSRDSGHQTKYVVTSQCRVTFVQPPPVMTPQERHDFILSTATTFVKEQHASEYYVAQCSKPTVRKTHSGSYNLSKVYLEYDKTVKCSTVDGSEAAMHRLTGNDNTKQALEVVLGFPLETLLPMKCPQNVPDFTARALCLVLMAQPVAKRLRLSHWAFTRCGSLQFKGSNKAEESYRHLPIFLQADDEDTSGFSWMTSEDHQDHSLLGDIDVASSFGDMEAYFSSDSKDDSNSVFEEMVSDDSCI